MVFMMLNNLSRRYFSHHIIIFYYTINIDIISSFIVFINLYLGSITSLNKKNYFFLKKKNKKTSPMLGNRIKMYKIKISCFLFLRSKNFFNIMFFVSKIKKLF